MCNLSGVRVFSAALALLVGYATSVLGASVLGASAGAEAYRAEEGDRTPKAATAEKAGLRSANIEGELKIKLLPPDVAKRAKQGAAKPPSIGPLEVGFGREIEADFSKVLDVGMLTWNLMPDGGQVARVTITSPGALGLRVGISVYQVPDAAVLDFFPAGVLDPPVEHVTGAAINETVARDRAARDKDNELPVLYWGPPTRGEAQGIDVFLPDGVLAKDLRIAVTRVSHLFETKVASLACPTGVGVNCAEACNLNAMCSGDAWDDVISAVAKMMFTTDTGGSAVCTGTLINDLDPGSQIPYFLTARHCINTQSVASTLATIWFFQTDGCTASHESKDFQTVSGGATLLAVLPEMDMTLLRLNSLPPDGAILAGWDTNPVAETKPVAGIHHPSGDLKKMSFGYMRRVEFCELVAPIGITSPVFGEGFFCNSSDNGTYYNVQYTMGTTEGGSSGSGIFDPNTHALLGTLTGGNASCGFQEGDNFYGRFDIAYQNSLHTWLGETDACNAEPGSWAYCANPACGPCDEGEGDCDSDSECKAGLICATDVGANYGWESTVDVCEQPSGDPVAAECRLSPGDWGYCADLSCGPCKENEGDCDSNIECVDGLVCLKDRGADFGFAPSVDVCGQPPTGSCGLPNGDRAYCSDPLCGPCAAGQGDCDRDADCNAGLVCAFDVGADYGFPESMDVCELPGEPRCTKSVGAWDYCGAPGCGPCNEGEGDCDSGADCAEGLVCAYNSGEQYGLSPTLDVCKAR